MGEVSEGEDVAACGIWWISFTDDDIKLYGDEEIPSKPMIQASPTSTAFQAIRPPTSHHVSRCLLTRPSSPRVIPVVREKSVELNVKLPSTARTKRTAGWMRSRRVL